MIQTNHNHDLPYRPNVGIMLINDKNQVFVGARLDHPGNWQMPQGGIDEGEEVIEAALREMDEEIGTCNAELIDEMPGWLSYDFPDHLINRLWNGKYKGQKQKWVAFRFTGSDSDINLEKHHEPEFEEWRWFDIDELLKSVVPFKKDVYRTVIEYFTPKL